MSVPSPALSYNPHSNNSPTTSKCPESVIRFPRPWLFGALAGFPPRALAVASAIIQWTTPEDRGGWCYYSSSELAEFFGWSLDTIKRALRDLRDAGILERRGERTRGVRIISPQEKPEKLRPERKRHTLQH